MKPDAELRAAVLPLIDYEAAYEVAKRRLGTRRKVTVDEIVDAALGLKENDGT